MSKTPWRPPVDLRERMLTTTQRYTNLDPDPATRRDPRTCEFDERGDPADLESEGAQENIPQPRQGRPDRTVQTLEERKEKARIYARRRRAELRNLPTERSPAPNVDSDTSR